ncbi:MAG: DUF4446 family protein [Candidatus Sungbacteria bacterium]|nr:DUF4446 family protein [Candidatus Sungbacteria bacterium]
MFEWVNPYAIGLLVLGLLMFILGGILYDMRRKFHRLFGESPPVTHEEALGYLLRRFQLTEKELIQLGSRVEVLESIGEKSFQKMSFMRFNPFADTGGDQSFVVCLLDKQDNGVIISSLYNREGTRVYAKAIEAGTPKQPLSDEEKKVLGEAMRS